MTASGDRRDARRHDLENGRLLVTPGTHKGPVWSLTGTTAASASDRSGRYPGPNRECVPLNRARRQHVVPPRARVARVRRSQRPTAAATCCSTDAAADAWPLLGVGDFDEFNSELLSGKPTLEPRMTSVPYGCRCLAVRQGSIYENQAGATRSYSEVAAQ